MDYYHNVNVFVRRMINKPEDWSKKFNPSSYKEEHARKDNTIKEYKPKMIKVQLIDTPSVQKLTTKPPKYPKTNPHITQTEKTNKQTNDVMPQPNQVQKMIEITPYDSQVDVIRMRRQGNACPTVDPSPNGDGKIVQQLINDRFIVNIQRHECWRFSTRNSHNKTVSFDQWNENESVGSGRYEKKRSRSFSNTIGSRKSGGDCEGKIGKVDFNDNEKNTDENQLIDGTIDETFVTCVDSTESLRNDMDSTLCLDDEGSEKNKEVEVPQTPPPVKSSDDEKTNTTSSVGTDNASDLLSHDNLDISRTSYKNFVGSLKRLSVRLRRRSEYFDDQHTQMKINASPKKGYANVSFDETDINGLRREYEAQERKIVQITNALEFCKQKKEFAGSIERVEVERQLLIENQRHAIITKKMQKIAQQKLQSTQNDANILTRGRLELGNFRVPFRSQTNSEYTHWFVILIFCDDKIYATEPQTAVGKKAIFNASFIVDNLLPDFKLTVHLYELKLKMGLKEKAEYRGSFSPPLLCPPKSRYSTKRMSYSFNHDTSITRQPEFDLIATKEITLKHLCAYRSGEFDVQMLKTNTNLVGKICMDVAVDIGCFVQHHGYLHVCEKFPDVWNMRYCTLDGFMLNYWRDQNDENPLQVINLKHIIGEVKMMNKTKCPRPRTIAVEVLHEERSKKMVYILSAVSHEDLCMWIEKLNEVVSVVRAWSLDKI